MPLYGYARVSTLDQDLSIQRTALKTAGCEVIRAEKASGARRDGRTELQVSRFPARRRHARRDSH
jgi:DNA invertase Pin-like site-specific DNA recombinase